MRPFTYERPDRIEDAVALSSANQAAVVAGGTNLVDLMRDHVRTPSIVVDISKLPLDAINGSDVGLVLGALATNTSTADHPTVRARYNALSEAILAGASQQIRNRATNGGNILQATRDPFYWNRSYGGADVNAERDFSVVDAASERLPLPYHAVLGRDGPSRAANPSDMATALAIYDPVITVFGPEGERPIAYSNFHRRSGRDPVAETSLRPGDIITAIRLPNPPAGRSAYLKVRERRSYSYALVSVAMHRGPQGTRIAFGSVAPIPWRARRAESVLNDGGSPEDAVAAEFEGVEVPDELAFKEPMLTGAVADLYRKLEA